MAEVNDNQREAIDPVRLDRCPDCGYLLIGLPEQGVCPECGFEYNRDMIVLYGWRRGWHADVDSARGWRFFALALASVLVVLPALLTVAALLVLPPHQVPLLYVLGTFALIKMLVGIVRRWRHNRQDAAAPVQLRLCPQGYAQQDGIGPVRLRPWSENTRMDLHRSSSKSYRIHRRFSLCQWPWSAINMEFDCDPATAGRIQERIRQWQRRAAM